MNHFLLKPGIFVCKCSVKVKSLQKKKYTSELQMWFTYIIEVFVLRGFVWSQGSVWAATVTIIIIVYYIKFRVIAKSWRMWNLSSAFVPSSLALPRTEIIWWSDIKLFSALTVLYVGYMWLQLPWIKLTDPLQLTCVVKPLPPPTTQHPVSSVPASVG